MAVPDLVTFEEAKSHLRVDHDEDDTDIELYRVAAIATVLNYIKQFERTEFDTLPVYDVDNPPTVIPWTWPVLISAMPPYWWPASKPVYRELPPYLVPTWTGSPTRIPEDIRAAILLVIGGLYKDREGEKDPISSGVASLLERWRDPTMA